MRRRRNASTALAAELDDGNGQRRTLGRVGSGAELIKQHKAVFVADLKNLYNILCMRRERGKRLLDGLLVADVSENLLVDVDRAAVVGRDMQAAFGHEREKADGLERDGLAAGVGAGDDERVKITAEAHRDGHDGLAGDERMAGADEVQLPVRPHLRADGAHGKGQTRPRENAFQIQQHVVVQLDLLTGTRCFGGKLGENALDLLALGHEQLAQLVVAVDGGHRLNEIRAAGGRDIVHEARKLALALGLDRDDEAVGADGHDRLLQNLRVGRRGDDLLQRFADLRALLADPAADRGKLAAGRVRDLVLGEDGGEDALLQILIRGDLLEVHIQHARLLRASPLALGIRLCLAGGF